MHIFLLQKISPSNFDFNKLMFLNYVFSQNLYYSEVTWNDHLAIYAEITRGKTSKYWFNFDHKLDIFFLMEFERKTYI